ncbi:MAG TPA: type 1 glutamine amidotransferase domain-containing protein [Anaerolineales bacterium]|nr:type 1 glutamine amidotransferase domain-containing protein [Anaerolineales bacterium]
MRLAGKHVVVLVEEGFEDLEYWVTVMRLQEEGCLVVTAGPKRGAVVRSKSGGLTAEVERTAEEVDVSSIDALVVPGGWAPDKLRRYPTVTKLVRKAFDEGKVIGMICHAGLVGISAGIVRGRRATGSLGIKDDLINAGAIWEDTPALRDGNMVWGRVVPDIPAFCRELVTAIAGG